MQTGYDADNVLTQTYPDGETVTNSYTGQGWRSGVTTQQGSTTTQLLANAAYSGVGGGFGELTGASLGGGTFQYSASYDLLDRATDLKVTRSSGGVTLFEQGRTFDGASNVSTASTTLATGTDNQTFRYDEQNRLAWASSATATPPCGGSNTAGTLSGAAYTQSFSYDVLGRLTYGPLGTYHSWRTEGRRGRPLSAWRRRELSPPTASPAPAAPRATWGLLAPDERGRERDGERRGEERRGSEDDQAPARHFDTSRHRPAGGAGVYRSASCPTP